MPRFYSHQLFPYVSLRFIVGEMFSLLSLRSSYIGHGDLITHIKLRADFFQGNELL